MSEVILKSRIPAILAETAAATEEAIARAALKIEDGAKSRSRVDTGNMRAGWQSRPLGPFAYEVYNMVPYTIFNEFGTVNMAPQPMLTPAVAEVVPELVHELRGAWL